MLTEEILQKYESTISFNAGSNLCHVSQTLLEEVRTLQQQNKEQLQLLVRAARIIDSGMDAGILRYNPVLWFMDYHKSIKGES